MSLRHLLTSPPVAFTDTYSWIPSTFAGQGWGDLYYQPGGANTPLVEKAVIDGIVDGFQNVQPGTYAQVRE